MLEEFIALNSSTTAGRCRICIILEDLDIEDQAVAKSLRDALDQPKTKIQDAAIARWIYMNIGVKLSRNPVSNHRANCG